MVRNRVTDSISRRYFFPALTVKLIGALSVGFIYQFYYDGGDTFNFFTHGSKYIWEAFKDSPFKALKLVLAKGEHYPDTFKYSTHIWYYTDLPSYFVVRVTAILDLFTFHTYSATASLFALLSFTGSWAMYSSFHKLYPKLHLPLALAILFVPSVFFWGSGIMKDTLTLTAVGWITFGFFEIFVQKNRSWWIFLLILISFYIIYSIKIYILLCLIPSIVIWYFLLTLSRLKSVWLKIIAAPVAVGTAVLFSYLAIDQVSKDNYRYSINRLSRTAEITAKWINYVSESEGGSGYTLGDFDYSTAGMIRKFPLAVNVTLFRPYLWEVKNPVMLLASVESIIIFIITVRVLFAVRFKIFGIILSNPLLVYCLIFSISFAFAVGFSTYNFGSLARYKIPLIPLYLSGLFIMFYENKAKKFSELELSE